MNAIEEAVQEATVASRLTRALSAMTDIDQSAPAMVVMRNNLNATILQAMKRASRELRSESMTAGRTPAHFAMDFGDNFSAMCSIGDKLFCGSDLLGKGQVKSQVGAAHESHYAMDFEVGVRGGEVWSIEITKPGTGMPPSTLVRTTNMSEDDFFDVVRKYLWRIEGVSGGAAVALFDKTLGEVRASIAAHRG